VAEVLPLSEADQENHMAKIKTIHGTKEHKVVTEREWIAARKALLVKEKKFTRLRDELNQQRRSLPWVKVEKEYAFDAPKGQETLAELFGDNSQLIVYHFMFGPGWNEGCPHCSYWADHYDATRVHLSQRDTSLIVVSRAPLKELEAFKKRMGWKFKWVSSFKSEFYNYARTKMDIDEREGVSAFYKDKRGEVFHTYSAYARGIEMLNTTYHFLDLTAKGRDEHPDHPQDWVRFHDKYRT